MFTKFKGSNTRVTIRFNTTFTAQNAAITIEQSELNPGGPRELAEMIRNSQVESASIVETTRFELTRTPPRD